MCGKVYSTSILQRIYCVNQVWLVDAFEFIVLESYAQYSLYCVHSMIKEQVCHALSPLNIHPPYHDHPPPPLSRQGFEGAPTEACPVCLETITAESGRASCAMGHPVHVQCLMEMLVSG